MLMLPGWPQLQVKLYERSWKLPPTHISVDHACNEQRNDVWSFNSQACFTKDTRLI